MTFTGSAFTMFNDTVSDPDTFAMANSFFKVTSEASSQRSFSSQSAAVNAVTNAKAAVRLSSAWKMPRFPWHDKIKCYDVSNWQRSQIELTALHNIKFGLEHGWWVSHCSKNSQKSCIEHVCKKALSYWLHLTVQHGTALATRAHYSCSYFLRSGPYPNPSPGPPMKAAGSGKGFAQDVAA